jgi:hypothetical protein
MSEDGLGLPAGTKYSKEWDVSIGKWRFKATVKAKAGGELELGESKAGGTYTKQHTREIERHNGHSTVKDKSGPLVEAALDTEVGGFQTELEGRIKDFNPKKIVDAVRSGKKGAFVKEFMGIQATHRWAHGSFHGIELAFSAGLDIDIDGTPVLLKGSGAWSPEKFEPKLRIQVELEAHIGLSREGWIWVAEQVGKQTVVRFCQEEGLVGTLNYLVSEGIMTLAASALAGIAGTLALSWLAETVTRDARRKGELLAQKMAYFHAYQYTLFAGVDPTLHTSGEYGYADPVAKELYRGGRRDAIEQARNAFAKLKIKANKDEEQMAWDYGILLTHYYRSLGRDAQTEMRDILWRRINQMVAP